MARRRGRGLCQLRSLLGLPEALLAPLGSGHRLSGSSHAQGTLC